MRNQIRQVICGCIAFSISLFFFIPDVHAYDRFSDAVQIKAVALGEMNSAAIDDHGTLWMWGDNRYGQLGNGTTERSIVPIKVMENVANISLSGNHSVAIKTDGSLWAWGSNESGQLGDGTTNDATHPVKVLDNVISVDAVGSGDGKWGYGRTAAIKADGSLWLWGSVGFDAYGDGRDEPSYVPVKIMDNVMSVKLDYYCTAMIKNDNSLWMWGENFLSQLSDIGTTSFPQKVMDNVMRLESNGCTAALKTDGTLWMWGANSSGQLGHAEKNYWGNMGEPRKAMDNVTAVKLAASCTAALTSSGDLWTWGSDGLGIRGDGSQKSGTERSFVMGDVRTVEFGAYHGAAIKNDGTLWLWGENEYGQIGNGTTQNSDVPIQLSLGSDYLYNEIDPGEKVVLPVEKLIAVKDPVSASNAVSGLTSAMTTEQKNSATGVDLATLYAETAVSKAASKEISGNEIIINKAAVTDLEAVADQTSSAVETALVNGGVTTARLVSNTVTLATDEPGEITIKIDPDILTTKVDKIRVETPTYALTLKVSDLAPDLTEILTITAEDIGSGYAPGNQNKKTTVKVNLPKGKTTNPVILSLPKDGDDTTYQAVVKTDGSATSSKYNPATTTMDGKVNTSGSFTVQTNQKDFTDIANKSAEMQKAIRYLASKGIINGTSTTEFTPDGSISRAEIAALLVRALGKLDNSAINSFADVKNSDWYYSAAGSSQRTGLINGYPDGTFQGTTTIAKDQILSVAARVLKTEMGYKVPGNTASYLERYSDTVAAWAQPEVALATKENLVVYRVDGTFKGESNMTRGDAAIIIYRLFQKIW